MRPRPVALEVPLDDTYDCDLRLALEDISAGVEDARGSQCLAESPSAGFMIEVLDDIDADCSVIHEELLIDSGVGTGD